MIKKYLNNIRKCDKQRLIFTMLTSLALLTAVKISYDDAKRPLVVDASGYHQTDTLIGRDYEVTIIDKSIKPEIAGVTDEEIELIALITMAEAEGECEKGKRLVIDTILNRVDSNHFPDTIHEVIYQPNQFESLYNGRVDRCYVVDDICQLVREEVQRRTNSEVVYFTAGAYGKYGKPIFQVGNHYFCKE